VLALLCSPHAPALATHLLFPDQIVVLGRHPLFVPYVDPGLALARRVRDDLDAHVARHGEPPRAIYLGNHGLFALGRTPEHVLQIPAMAVKASRVLAGALAAGGATPLTEADADRIDARLDEHYRRERLERAADG
jgi:rhamnose utilization protein RhaD (predicted bifunctional aldolase and dehydrogenase)